MVFLDTRKNTKGIKGAQLVDVPGRGALRSFCSSMYTVDLVRILFSGLPSRLTSALLLIFFVFVHPFSSFPSDNRSSVWV